MKRHTHKAYIRNSARHHGISNIWVNMVECEWVIVTVGVAVVTAAVTQNKLRLCSHWMSECCVCACHGISFHPSWSIEAFVLQQIKYIIWWLILYYHHHHHLETKLKYSKKRIIFFFVLFIYANHPNNDVRLSNIYFRIAFHSQFENEMDRLS